MFYAMLLDMTSVYLPKGGNMTMNMNMNMNMES
jgi:hypothetical protein